MEDKIKEELEGYESRLPENSLDDFMAKVGKAMEKKPVGRRKPLSLWLAPVAAAAAVIALVLIPRADVDSEVSLPEDESEQVAEVQDVERNTEASGHPAAAAVMRHGTAHAGKAVQSDRMECVPESAQSSESSGKDAEDDDIMETSESKDRTGVKDFSGSPFIPSSESTVKKDVKISTGNLTAGIIGGAGAVTLAAVLPSVISTDGMTSPEQSDNFSPGSDDVPSTQIDRRSGNDTHHMPLRAGVSLRVPFSDRWSLVTGIDYSWYSSSIGYTLSGDRRQNVHYLGIPMRADFTVVKSRAVNVYAGAGAEADFCIAADLGGEKIDRDGVGFSLLGAGGIQFNLFKGVGLYIEPVISWDIPSEKRMIDTYRAEHQVMFSVTSGIRFSIPYSD